MNGLLWKIGNGIIMMCGKVMSMSPGSEDGSLH